MIGLQEIKQRLEKEEYKDINMQVKEMLDHGYYDHEEVNIFGKGIYQREQRVTPLKAEDAKEVMDSVRGLPLREFLASSTTTAVGSSYLIPTKIHQVMFDAAVQEDIVAAISMAIIPAEQIPGTTHKVDIAVDGSYVPKKFMSGGQIPTETIATTQATLDFTESFGVNFRITNDLIEDSQFDLIEMHIRDAGREMGEFASDLAAHTFTASTDGDGTLNTEAGGVDVTTLLDVMNAIDANLADGFVSDTYLLSHHLIWSTIAADTTYSMDATGFRNDLITNGYPPRLLGLNMIYSEIPTLSYAAGLDTGVAYNDLDSFVFTKQYALLTGRKRWLRIENYNDPVRDLVGATVTSRQDSVTVYDDSICRIRET